MILNLATNWDAPWSLQIGSLEHLRKGSRGLMSSATTCAAESSRDFSWRGGGLPNSISDNLEKHIVSPAILISPGFLFSSFPYQRPVGREREREGERERESVHVCVCMCVYLGPKRKMTTQSSNTHYPPPATPPSPRRGKAVWFPGGWKLCSYYYGIGSPMNHLLELLSALWGMVPIF